MTKLWIVAAAVLATALLAASPASTFPRDGDVTITAPDGTALAATLFLPTGEAPPGGYPAVVFMHGLGGNRAGTIAIARAMGMIGEEYVVLAVDARGHGESGGLIGIDGPNEIADTRAVFEWLRDRPDVADARIGAWGISYGGGAAWNSLAAGVPWAALEPVETWTDLEQALAPQGLVKTGVVAGFLSSLPPERIDPAVIALRNTAFAGRTDGISAFGAARSSLKRLRGVRTPVFMMQGRRDFAFGIDQATAAYRLLAGPKRLWIGNHGHAPSAFPAADTAAMLREGKLWFDRFLRGAANGIDRGRPVIVARSGSARVERFAQIPAGTFRTGPYRFTFTRTIRPNGKIVLRTAPLRRALEVFGSPSVTVATRPGGGWSRVVAVLSATAPAGTETVVGGGGVPLGAGPTTVTIRLSSQATYVPKGSTLVLTLASSSLAQNPANLLYLDLPLPIGSRLTAGPVTLRIPELVPPVSR